MNLICAENTAGCVARISSYPLTILKACSSIDEVAEFRDLPDGYIVVVMRLVKKMSVATPDQAIFARRDTLARESGKSCETVGRAIKWLEQRGLITRVQKAAPGLRGSEAPIRPTARLIAALGFGGNSVNKVLPAVNIDASVSALQEHNLKKQSNEISNDNAKLSTDVPAITFVKKAPGTQSVLIGGVRIPPDLVWLVKELKVLPSGVLFLMTQAKNAGKFLSDVVAVVRPCLLKLRGRELIAYVRKLLSQNKDYAFIRKMGTDKEAVENKTNQDRALVDRKAQEWRGRRFESRNGSSYTVEDNGYLAVVKSGVNGVSGGQWIDLAFVDAVMDGLLRAV